MRGATPPFFFFFLLLPITDRDLVPFGDLRAVCASARFVVTGASVERDFQRPRSFREVSLF